jgi:hypothetical protein
MAVGLFKKKDTRPPKEQIFDMVSQLAATRKYQDYGFRMYKTYQGARVIVSGRDFDPRAAETNVLWTSSIVIRFTLLYVSSRTVSGEINA